MSRWLRLDHGLPDGADWGTWGPLLLTDDEAPKLGQAAGLALGDVAPGSFTTYGLLVGASDDLSGGVMADFDPHLPGENA